MRKNRIFLVILGVYIFSMCVACGKEENKNELNSESIEEYVSNIDDANKNRTEETTSNTNIGDANKNTTEGITSNTNTDDANINTMETIKSNINVDEVDGESDLPEDISSEVTDKNENHVIGVVPPENTTTKNQYNTEQETTTAYVEPRLNYSEIILYGGYNVWSGCEYVGQDYIDYSTFFAELHIFSANDKDIIWRSDNEKIAKVDKGKVTPTGYGRTTITAKYKGKEYKCKVVVKEIRTFFYIDYTYEEENDMWIWKGSFVSTKGKEIKYKITEREYDEKGSFVKETDITNKTILSPVVEDAYTIDKERGVLVCNLDYTDQFDCTSDIECTFCSYECYDRYDNGEIADRLINRITKQKLILKIYAKTKDYYDDRLKIEYDSSCVYLVPKDYMGIFTFDDVFIPDCSWNNMESSLDEFTWISSNPNVIEIGTQLGSKKIRYGINSIIYKGCGTATITVKRGDKVIDSVIIDVTQRMVDGY